MAVSGDDGALLTGLVESGAAAEGTFVEAWPGVAGAGELVECAITALTSSELK